MAGSTYKKNPCGLHLLRAPDHPTTPNGASGHILLM